MDNCQLMNVNNVTVTLCIEMDHDYVVVTGTVTSGHLAQTTASLARMFQLKVSSQYYTASVSSTHISSLVARLSTKCLHVTLLYEKQMSDWEGGYVHVTSCLVLVSQHHSVQLSRGTSLLLSSTFPISQVVVGETTTSEELVHVIQNHTHQIHFHLRTHNHLHVHINTLCIV